jgi:hypothetical protein
LSQWLNSSPGDGFRRITPKGLSVKYNPRINSVTFLLCGLAAIATGKVQAQSATGYHLLNRLEVGGEGGGWNISRWTGRRAAS